MPQNKYEVTLSDGRKFVVEADSQPSEQDVMTALGSQAEPAQPKSGGFEGYNAIGRGLKSAWDWTKGHPVEAAAAGGAVLAAPFTGGGSILGGMAAAGLGAAGGAGAAITGRQLVTGRPESGVDTAATMLKQGALNAAGEGAGRGVVAGANVLVPKILKGILRPSKPIQQRFGDVVGTMRRERIPVGQSAVADTKVTQSADAVDALLRAKDAERPMVRGYLGPAREAVPLGPRPNAPDGPSALTPAQATMHRVTKPGTPDPDRTSLDGLVTAREQLGGAREALPVERLGFSDDEIRLAESLGGQSRTAPTRTLLGEGQPPRVDYEPQYSSGEADVLNVPEFSGPAARMQDLPFNPGPGAHGTMVDPRDLVSGLQGARADLGNRALAQESTGQLDALAQSFLRQRTRPMTLTQTNAMKRAEQKLADTAFKAESAGHPVNGIEAMFHEGMAGGAQRAIESRVPQVAGMNARTRELMGLTDALQDAEARSGAGIMNLNPLSWVGNIAPGLGSKAAFAGDAAAAGTQGTQARLIRQALLSLLAGDNPERPE